MIEREHLNLNVDIECPECGHSLLLDGDYLRCDNSLCQNEKEYQRPKVVLKTREVLFSGLH